DAAGGAPAARRLEPFGSEARPLEGAELDLDRTAYRQIGDAEPPVGGHRRGHAVAAARLAGAGGDKPAVQIGNQVAPRQRMEEAAPAGQGKRTRQIERLLPAVPEQPDRVVAEAVAVAAAEHRPVCLAADLLLAGVVLAFIRGFEQQERPWWI